MLSTIINSLISLNNLYLFTIVIVLIILIIGLLYRRDDKNIIKKMKPMQPIPGYHTIYCKEKTDTIKLYSKKYDLTGKPDYIFKLNWGKSLVPVKLKNKEIGGANKPFSGDILQLAAYFLIIEEVYNTRPKFGRLIYKDWMFEIKNVRYFRDEVKLTLDNMRCMLSTGKGSIRDKYAVCSNCMCKDAVCEHWKNRDEKT